MDRRNFLGSLIGGIAATAAVRSWPFRVYSFPSELNILNPIVGQTLYVTNAAGHQFFKVGDMVTLEGSLPKFSMNKAPVGYFRIMEIDTTEATMDLRFEPLDPHNHKDLESVRAAMRTQIMWKGLNRL
jgi:hypothetical protein